MSNLKPQIVPFGTTKDGVPVSEVVLDNGVISCSVLTYGATLRCLWVPGKDGKAADVVLGYDTLKEYEENKGYFGATVGRYANRIGGSAFTLNGESVSLSANEGKNHIHGGFVGFSRRVWDVKEATGEKLVLTLFSPDGEEGYPGNLTATVTYSLAGSALQIRYQAVSDKDTICNMTNHSYFNLDGHDSGAVLRQKLSLSASAYTPVDDFNIPVGEVLAVEGTPMDLRTPIAIGERIGSDYHQISRARGYDHNFIIDRTDASLRPAAFGCGACSGITMAVSTTMPGVQLYTANFLAEGRQGKGGCAYGLRHGFCLETQYFPDSPNCPQFPSPVLRAGEAYDHMTEFKFGQVDA